MSELAATSMKGGSSDIDNELVDRRLFAMIDELRGSPSAMSSNAIAKEAVRRGIPFDLDALLRLTPRLGNFGEWVYPRVLLDFIGDFARELGARSVLDAWAANGELLLSISRRTVLERGLGVCIRRDQYELAQILTDNPSVQWLFGDPAHQVPSLDGVFDFVTSSCPWNHGTRVKKTVTGGQAINDDIGSLINFEAIEKLNPQGRAIFVVNSGYVTHGRESGWFSQRAELGITLEALIHVPTGFFDHTQIDGYLCVFSKLRGDGQVFIGQLSPSNAEHNKLLLENLVSRRASPDITLGRLHIGEFRGFQQLVSDERGRVAARSMGLESTPLRDLLIETNLTKSSGFDGFPKRDNSLFLPLLGRSKAAVSDVDLKLKAHNYAQLVLDPSRASASYVSSFFNTALGLQCRESMQRGAVIPKLSKESIFVGSVYLPDIKTQQQCVAIESEALNLKSEIEDVLQALYKQPRKYRAASQALKAVNRDDSFERWLASLPFPLASVLGVYHANSNDDRTCYEALGHSFEALGEFVALILWSAVGVNEHFIGHARYPFKAGSPLGYSVRRSSFGSWNEIASRIAKFVRILVNEPETRPLVQSAFGDPLDLSSLEMLYSTSLVTALESANTIRNRKAHGGIMGAADAKARRSDLETLLATVRATMSSNWVDFPLFRAGAARLKAGTYSHDVERLMGRATPFDKVVVPLDRPIEDGNLFLLPAGSKTPLVLAPLLKIGPSPNNAPNACYFYNSEAGDKLRYVSYHFDQEAELLLNDEESAAALASLIAATE